MNLSVFQRLSVCTNHNTHTCQNRTKILQELPPGTRSSSEREECLAVFFTAGVSEPPRPAAFKSLMWPYGRCHPKSLNTKIMHMWMMTMMVIMMVIQVVAWGAPRDLLYKAHRSFGPLGQSLHRSLGRHRQLNISFLTTG